MAIIQGEKVLDILGNKNRVIYIPIYQRNYDWNEKDATTLLEDIWNFRKIVSKDNQSLYYAGSMIYKRIKDDNSSEDKISLVDGQQRITTFLLLIKAIDSYDNIANSTYLFSNSNNKKILKISRAKSETTLEKILTGKHSDLSDEEKNSNYWNNYVAMKNKIKEKQIDTIKFFGLLKNSVGVSWVLLKEAEDENKVFETINSTGKPLTASDLIKNNILSKIHTMSKEQESELENIYNNRIEDIFSQSNFKNDDFFRYYIAIKNNGVLVNKKEPKKIYFAFKEMIKKKWNKH